MMIETLTRPWEIWLVHHTHVDIGYTEPQDIILRKHPEFIAQALDDCTATDDLPPGEQFCWTCEVSWTVKAFLAQYPARAEEFFRRVREGRIEVTGLYLQLTDLFTEELLAEAVRYAEELAHAHEFSVVTAMNDDVNGWAWGLPKLLTERGIRYFDTAINETRALGVRPRPRPYYWAAPGGERVLLWHGDGYLHGNALAFHRPGADERVAAYLHGLEAGGYQHHVVQVRIHGEGHDNAPPGRWISAAIRDWNARHAYPRLRLITPRTWFAEVETHWPEPIVEWHAGWPDWWADGNGSALYEAAAVRTALADLQTAAALQRAGSAVDTARVERAREAAMFFCEHTWGAWNSTDDPDSLEARAQWNHKAGYAYTAANEAKACVQQALTAYPHTPGDGPLIAVFNPLPWVRSDMVEVLVLDEVVHPAGATWVTTPQRVEDGLPLHLVDVDTGVPIAVTRRPAIADSARRPAQRITFLAKDVPAGGWRYFRLVAEPWEASSVVTAVDGVLENAHYRLTLDPITGGIRSLLAKGSGRELVRAGDYTLNQCIYETIDDPQGRERLCGWQGIRRDVPWLRRSPAVVRRQPDASMPFGARLVVEGTWGEGLCLRSEIRLYDELPWVDIVNTLTKPPTATAEAIYQAFPLAAASPTVYLDVPGAVLRPGVEQVPGTATDWHSIQHYFAVAAPDSTTVIASPDVPLVQVNGINTGLWQETLPAHNGLVMSWVMNNYWFTNFPARQGGAVTYRYRLANWSAAFDAETATRFALGSRQPLYAVVCPA